MMKGVPVVAWAGLASAARQMSVDGVLVGGWVDRFSHVGAGGTTFVAACERSVVRGEHGEYPLPPGGFAVVPGEVCVVGGAGLWVHCPDYRGLFVLGGPVEPSGRLRYIDGCSDTVLVAPLVRGDPCLNFLHIPPGVVQTDHQHPSLRAGLVLRGDGVCVADGDARMPLCAGTVFVLEAGTVHRFESGSSPLDIVAWHPDSDFGPTDEDHPMLNRTLQPGTDRRLR